MDFKLQNKVAFVSASSRGLGKSCAMQLAKEGATVVISGRNREELKKVKEDINLNFNNRVDYVICDITKKEDIHNAVAFTINKYQRIDILINNSGGPPSGKFEELNEQEWHRSFELNLLSYVRMIKEVLPYMKEQNYGKIINLASTSIKQPIPDLILSNTFRAGVLGLSKSLSNELAPYNIHVNTVAPGKIATDRVKYLDKINADRQGLSVKEIQEQSKKEIPLNRYGDPQEFGAVVAFLASDVSSYMTGTSILIDGGMVKSF